MRIILTSWLIAGVTASAFSAITAQENPPAFTGVESAFFGLSRDNESNVIRPFGAFATDLPAVQLPSRPSPGPRSAHVLIYHPLLQRVVLLDGYVSDVPARSAVWVWDGRSWQSADALGPPARARGAAAYDAKRNRVVVFGGRVGPDAFTRADTWTWDGKAWRELTDATIGIRDHHAMVYDDRRGVIVVYGGTVPQANTGPQQQTQWQYPTDTWELDGERWNRITGEGPGTRNIAAMAYDAKHGQTVLFGGSGEDRVYRGDTWTWNGTEWRQVATTGPSPRGDARMAYDSVSGSVILYGGSRGRQQLQDMWRWNGTRWTEIPLSGPTPGPRAGHAMAFDVVRDRLVLYGGFSGDTALGDTWEWDGESWLKAQ